MKGSRKLAVLVTACATALAARQAMAITVDGTVDSGYGGPIVSQTINTGFGDDTTGNGNSSNGSELDAAYSIVQNGMLYVALTGNFQNNGNHVDLFIDDGRGGSNILQASNGGAMAGGMNGSGFSSGFNPTYALDANDYQGTLYLDTYSLFSNSGGYAGFVPLTGGIGSGTLAQVQIALNNTNAAGVNGTTGTAVTDPSIPNAVTTGLEFGIPLALLGNPTNPIKIMAALNGGNDGYLSNQFLPGLPTGTVNLGTGTPVYSGGANTGKFNFSSLAGEYFSVNVPSLPNGIWLAGSGNWSSSSNWSNSIVPNAVDAAAQFTNTAGGTVMVDNNFTVGSISLVSPTGYTLQADQPTHVLTMSVSTGDATISDFSGTHEIATDLVLASNTDVLMTSNGDSLLILGDISGPGSFSSRNGGGNNGSILYLLGNDTYTGGTIINSGEVQLDSPTAFPTDTALTMNATDVPDPTLDLGGNNITFSSLASITGPNTGSTGAIGLIINTGGAVTVTYAGDPANPSTFYGRFVDNTANSGGATSLVISTGSLTITGTSTSTTNQAPASFTGSTTINTGATLTLAAASGGGALSQTSSITNNGTLNIDDFESIGAITNNGSLTIGTGGTLQIRPGTGPLTLASAGLSLSGGKIDVVNSALILTYTTGNDPIATIRNAFAAGDVISSTATTVVGTSVGYADGNTDTGTAAAAGTILIRYTWLGDLNLDGSVTGADFNVLQANFGNTNADWAHGDLNYDGVVNADDVSLFQLGAAEAGSNTLPLPEPASIALLALPLLGLRRRRAV